MELGEALRTVYYKHKTLNRTYPKSAYGPTAKISSSRDCVYWHDYCCFMLYLWATYQITQCSSYYVNICETLVTKSEFLWNPSKIGHPLIFMHTSKKQVLLLVIYTEKKNKRRLCTRMGRKIKIRLHIIKMIFMKFITKEMCLHTPQTRPRNLKELLFLPPHEFKRRSHCHYKMQKTMKKGVWDGHQ